MMRNTLIILLLVLLASCDEDKFRYRTFQVDQADLLTAIDLLYEKHPQYRCPNKWTIDDSYSMKGQEFSSVRRFYFLSPIEEMYYVTVLPFGNETKIVISAVHTNTGWHLEKDLPSAEIERIEKRFNDQVVSKLEILMNLSTANKKYE